MDRLEYIPTRPGWRLALAATPESADQARAQVGKDITIEIVGHDHLKRSGSRTSSMASVST